MLIYALKENPLSLYQSSRFSVKDKNIAMGISSLIHFLFSDSVKKIRWSPTFTHIKKVDYSEIRSLVFAAIDYARSKEKSKKSHKVSDLILYFNLDGEKHSYTYADIANIRNIKSASDIERYIQMAAYTVRKYLLDNGIKKILVDEVEENADQSQEENSTKSKEEKKGFSSYVSKAELLDFLDGAIENIEKELKLIKKVREELAK